MVFAVSLEFTFVLRFVCVSFVVYFGMSVLLLLIWVFVVGGCFCLDGDLCCSCGLFVCLN